MSRKNWFPATAALLIVTGAMWVTVTATGQTAPRPAPASKAVIKLKAAGRQPIRLDINNTVVCVRSANMNKLSESIPCCKSDSNGCICSSEDCDDCKGVTRESIATVEVATP